MATKGGFLERIAREIRRALAGRVAGFQVSAPFGRIDVALKVLAD